MKRKITAMLVCILLVLSLLPATALAAGEVPAGYNVHDYTAIRSFLETTVDGVTNGSRVATAYNADNPETWEVGFITSEDDGEKYVNSINWLDKGLSGSLDLSNFTELTFIDCRSNSFTELTVTNDTKLSQLKVESNQLTSLDLSTNSSLSYLYCNDNALTTLDTPNSGDSLWVLECYRNSLTSIDVSANTGLERFICSENNLTALDVSNLNEMTNLECTDNALTTLNLAGCGALTELYCYNNALTSLALNDCTNLTTINCGNNKLSSLDLSAIHKVTSLSFNDNALITPYFGDNAVTWLDCSNCGFTALDFSALTSLTNLTCSSNTLASFKLGANIEKLDCSNCGLTALDLSTLTNLTELTCSGNAFTSLNLGTKLTSLDCSNCGLTTLDLSTLTSLMDFTCDDNMLTSLDLSKNTLLTGLECNDNRLSALDLSLNTHLYDLECRDNCLSSLDLTKNPDMFYLDAKGNPLKQIDASINGAAISLTAKDGGYAELFYNGSEPELYATAVPVGPAVFYNWTNGTAEAAATAKYDLPASTAVDLDVNFLQLSGSLADGKIECGSSFTLSPSIAGGTWAFDSAYLSRSGNTFTALKEGTTTVTYTLNGKTASFDITISASLVPTPTPTPTLTLAASPSDGKIYVGGQITVTPNIEGGTWSFDSTYLSQSGNTFTGNKAGTTRVVYTVKGQSASIDVTVTAHAAVGLSCTKTDTTVYGGANGSITINATGGDSGRYEYSLNGGAWQSANVFSGLGAGTYTAAVRDAANTINTASCAITISQPAHMGNVAAKKLSSKAAAGTALTIVPPAAPKGYALVSVTYSSSNPSVVAVDASGNVTFLTGGKAKIITKSVYQMTDKKGKIKTKTTTVSKTITVKQPVAAISLSLSNTNVIRTQKVKLTAALSPDTASNKKLIWKSSNPKVAAVSSGGVVTGKAVGSAVITCTAKDGSGAAASCTVTVSPINPTGLKLSKAALTVKTGKTTSLKAKLMPKNTDFKTVTWQSSNPSVATVDAKGKVVGVAAGTATVTATASNGLTASCTVTVK